LLPLESQDREYVPTLRHEHQPTSSISNRGRDCNVPVGSRLKGEETYEMVKRKFYMLSVLVFPVEEVVDGEGISLIHMFWVSDRLKHGPDDDIWIDDCEIEDWLFGSNEIPCGLFAKLLGSVVAKHRGLGFDCFLFCNLVI
jgi:hypothetical protein